MRLLQRTTLQRKRGIGQGVVQYTKTVHQQKWGGASGPPVGNRLKTQMPGKNSAYDGLAYQS